LACAPLPFGRRIKEVCFTGTNDVRFMEKILADYREVGQGK
jgi:hypothetical protein